jgi:exodeoxyribonuclease VII large subunit
VWGFAPVQDRHAAPRITAALQDLAATGAVDVIVVARGGGSLADLFCFCDETLCRTVALLGVPVIASVGHHTDRTLIDDVAALSCSTPTHAAESAVPVHCDEARGALTIAARRLHVHARRAPLQRAQTLVRLSRAPGEHLARQRARLHQTLREIRAASRRRLADERTRIGRRALVVDRRVQAEAQDARRATRLTALSLALAAHDPQRNVERGYALVTDRDGEVVTSAASARRAAEVSLRFSDAAVDATIHGDDRA